MQRTFALVLTIPAIWLLFHFWSGGAVLSAGNMVNLFKYLTVVGILATGMTFVMAAGHIDLSVGSGLGFLGAVSAYCIYNHHFSLLSALAVSLALAVVMGLIHGSVVAFFQVPAFIVTLSGLMAYMGLKQFLANPVIPIQNPGLLYLGQGYLSPWQGYAAAGLFIVTSIVLAWRNAVGRRKHGLRPISSWRTGFGLAALIAVAFIFVAVGNADRGVPVCVLAMLLTAAACHFLAVRTRFGRHVFALGSNRQAAIYSGISIPLHTLGVFILMAVLTWLAGLVATSQLMAAAADIGDYQELYAIAACVIGGTSLRGGTGNVWMSLLGALLMASILNGMEQVGIPSTMQKVILGVILTGSVALDQILADNSIRPVYHS
jgi:D-xylose transport system permease protein